MITHWKNRLRKPFWSSSKNRYCTSDEKRDPINVFFTSTDENFIISCEGIRGQESTARGKKIPLKLRGRKCSTFYSYPACDVKTRKPVEAWMSVEEAIEAYDGVHKPALDWYPIFNYTVDEVWATKGMSVTILHRAREFYKETGKVPGYWPFHPAYVYGNDRVSCVFCILGSPNDLAVGAEHHPELLETMIQMEDEGDATFKDGWSLRNLLNKQAVYTN
jgi:hypothetical protein